MKKLLVKNIGLLATPEGKSAHRGSEQGKIKLLKSTPRESLSRRVSWTPIRTSFSAAGGRTSWA